MRNLFIILFLCISCSVANTHDVSTASEYTHVVLPNKIGNDYIISDSVNNEDSIFFEDVFYFKETDDTLCVLGNLLGSKSSLFVILNKNNNTIIYRKQSAKIDSATHVSCGGRELITVNKSYQDMCTREIFYSIYMLTKDSLKECFDDYKKNEYIGAEDYCSEKFVSYNQFFSFDVIRDSLIVNITKIDENEKKEIKRHSISLK
ncbi:MULTISPECIES: hypothetical protein [unclassified Bacteroides]|uniref:hypothetical protein n=1 Tax=unclassified Bacteroides TaxID=2646097 RepID=UPI0004E0ED2C|nr:MULTISPECIES: hypothetical protein [unclassified Bacteroides]